MPEMDGWALGRAAGDAGVADVPVIVLSAARDLDAKTRAGARPGLLQAVRPRSAARHDRAPHRLILFRIPRRRTPGVDGQGIGWRLTWNVPASRVRGANPPTTSTARSVWRCRRLDPLHGPPIGVRAERPDLQATARELHQAQAPGLRDHVVRAQEPVGDPVAVRLGVVAEPDLRHFDVVHQDAALVVPRVGHAYSKRRSTSRPANGVRSTLSAIQARICAPPLPTPPCRCSRGRRRCRGPFRPPRWRRAAPPSGRRRRWRPGRRRSRSRARCRTRAWAEKGRAGGPGRSNRRVKVESRPSAQLLHQRPRPLVASAPTSRTVGAPSKWSSASVPVPVSSTYCARTGAPTGTPGWPSRLERQPDRRPSARCRRASSDRPRPPDRRAGSPRSSPRRRPRT